MMDLIAHLKKHNICEDDLDDLVHEAASTMAAEVNNRGFDVQVDFLLENGWTADEICEALDIRLMG